MREYRSWTLKLTSDRSLVLRPSSQALCILWTRWSFSNSEPLEYRDVFYFSFWKRK